MKKRLSLISKRIFSGEHQSTIAVDLDGTLLEYEDWKGEDSFGEMREGAMELLKELKSKGCRIIIYTCRGDDKAVKRYLEENGVPFDFINENPDQPPGTSDKLYADVYLDDKAVSALDLNKAKEEIFRMVE